MGNWDVYYVSFISNMSFTILFTIRVMNIKHSKQKQILCSFIAPILTPPNVSPQSQMRAGRLCEPKCELNVTPNAFLYRRMPLANISLLSVFQCNDDRLLLKHLQ